MAITGTYQLLVNMVGSSDKASAHYKPLPKGSKQQKPAWSGRWMVLPIAVFFIWALLCISAMLWTSNDVPFKSAHRVLLVTAHPDDETIFFSPTISGITASGKRLYLLCLSTGNAYGLGDVRLREIRSASDALGIPDDQVTVLNHTLLQDGKQSEWDIDTISSVVTDFTTRHGIDTIVTFDHNGITQHPNHLAVHAGISKLVAHCQVKDDHPHKKCPTAWALVTSKRGRGPMSIIEHLDAFDDHPDHTAGYTNRNVVRTFFAMGAHKSQSQWWRHVLTTPFTLVNAYTRITAASWLDISKPRADAQSVLLRMPQNHDPLRTHAG